MLSKAQVKTQVIYKYWYDQGKRANVETQRHLVNSDLLTHHLLPVISFQTVLKLVFFQTGGKEVFWAVAQISQHRCQDSMTSRTIFSLSTAAFIVRTCRVAPSEMCTVLKNPHLGTSLVAQWLRIHLPMQGTRVWTLGREDPTCRGATKPMRHNYWACTLEPVCHNYWACVTQLLKPAHLETLLHNKRSHRNEKPAHRNQE